MRINNLFTLVALLVALVTVSPAQHGASLLGSSMQSTSFTITNASASEGSYSAEISWLGDQLSDTAVWKLSGFDIVFNNPDIQIWIQNPLGGFAVAGTLSLELYHGDTVVSTSSYTISPGNTQWSVGTFSGPWSGNLSRIDGIGFKVGYFWGSELGQVILRVDDMGIKTGNEYVTFYRGGDVGSISGNLWSDENSNSQRDSTELSIAGRKIYLSGTMIDSTVTDSAGNYKFVELPHGEYEISQALPVGWVQTFPFSETANISISTDSTVVHANMGSVVSNGHAYRVNRRWNLVSVPLNVPDFSKATLYPTAVSNAFAYDNGYQAVETLRVGPGYWIKFPFDQYVMLLGDTVLAETVSVVPGWNIIGGLSVPVAARDIESNPGGMTVSTPYGYSGGYSISDTLWPGRGYWVKVSEAGELILRETGSVQSNSAHYRIRLIATDDMPPPPPGETMHEPEQPPKTLHLLQNYPNPFNPLTVISYELPATGDVSLKIFNLLGEEITTLVNERKETGRYSVQWDGTGYPSGVYFYRLEAGTFTETRKLLLVR